MINPINNIADWRYICQYKQVQIYKYVIHENTTMNNHDSKVGDKVMTLTLFRGPYEIVHTWTNVPVTLRTGAVTMRINIRNIKPYNTPVVEGRDHPQEV